MKRQYVKRLLTVTAISVILTVGVVLAVYFGIKFETYGVDVYERAVAYTVLSLWAFSAVPAYVKVCEWLSEKSFAESFWYGYVFGFFLPLLVAPVLAVFYYVSTVEKLIKEN